MPTVTIIECTDPTGLYTWYNGQGQRQECEIVLDLHTGHLSAGIDPYITGRAAPENDYRGYAHHWRIPLLTAEGANRLMTEIKPLAQRMCDDWHEETDYHHTTRAVLGPDAETAAQAIDDECRTWEEACEYLIAVHEVVGLEEGTYEITATTTNEQLEQYADELTAEVAKTAPSGVAIYPGLLDYYIQLRDERREEQQSMSTDLTPAEQTAAEHFARLYNMVAPEHAPAVDAEQFTTEARAVVSDIRPLIEADALDALAAHIDALPPGGEALQGPVWYRDGLRDAAAIALTLAEARQAAGAEAGRAAALEAAYREAHTGRDARDAEIQRLTAKLDAVREVEPTLRHIYSASDGTQAERAVVDTVDELIGQALDGDGVTACTGCGRCSVCRRGGVTAHSVLGLDPAETDARDKYEQ